MAKLNDLTSNQVQERKRQVRTYGTKTDLASTVVERGSTHWAEGSNVHIDGLLGVAGTATVSGTLRVTGLLDVTGTFNGSGTNNLDGTNNLSGDNNLTGPTTIDGVLTINGDTSITGLLEVTGDTTISGTLDIDGVTTLNNDLNVTNSGEINVGTNMTLTPSTDGGSILFQDGSKVTSIGGTVQSKSSGAGSITAGLNSANISAGAGFISVDDLGDWSLSGGAVLQSNGTAVKLTGSLEVTSTARFSSYVVMSGLPTTGAAANLFVQGDGFIYKSTSASRFKLDQQAMDLPATLLDIPMKDWLDAGQVQRGEAVYRIPGVIAEDVYAAGGEAFNTFTPEGDLEGVMYDRLAMARTELLHQRVKAIEKLMMV